MRGYYHRMYCSLTAGATLDQGPRFGRHADTGEREILDGAKRPTQWKEAVPSHRYHRLPMVLSTVMPRVPR